jgi:hypothetical protein
VPAIYRSAPATTQKVLSGQFLFQLAGLDANGLPHPLRNLGNVEVVRTVKTETLDIYSNEIPEKPILKRVTITLNEELKITCMSFLPLVQGLSHMAPAGENFQQVAVPDGEVNIPATAKDYDIYECRDHNGNRVYGVTFTSPDKTKYNYDSQGGRVEVIGDRSASDQVAFTCPAITTANGLAVLRMLQLREIRGRAVIRENNLLGAPYDHDYPTISIRMNSSQNLIDNGKEPSKVELDALVEFDTTQPIGLERGQVVEMPGYVPN